MNILLRSVRFCFAILLLTIFVSTNAIASLSEHKVDSTYQVIRVTPHFGLVIPHHEEMTYFINDFSYGIDINYGITKYGKKWYQYTNYPEIGFGLFYNSFGNPDIFGFGLSGYGYIQPTIFRSKKFSFNSKLALGLGFVNKPYQEETNPYNHVFGSTFNVFIGLGIFAKYKISPRWTLSGNLSYNHLSNGSIKKPNHGVNTLTLGIGAGFNINSIDTYEMTTSVQAPHSNARDLIVFLSVGKSQRSLYKPTDYPAVTLNVNHLWWVSKKTAWGVGIDGIYYGAAPYDYLLDNNQFSDEEEIFSHKDKMYGSIFGSYNFRFNNTQIFFHVGAYLLYTIEPKQLIYPRLGVRQRIYKNLYGNFSIKASFFKAEFIEFGLGYRINYKKNEL